MFANFYYCFYTFFRNIGGESEESLRIKASTFLTLLQSINIMAVCVTLIHHFRFRIALPSSTAAIVIMMAALYVLNYFLMYKRHEKIVMTIQNSSSRKRAISLLSFWLYLIFSIIFLIYS
jgi:hypothetical protein